MAKKKDPTFYYVDHKGSLTFVDILSYNRQTKQATFINDKVPEANFGLTETRVALWHFEKIKKSLIRKGYTIEEIDGAEERIDKDRMIKALDCCFNKETVYELTKLRPEIYPYYSLKRIRMGLRRYVHGELTDLYLNYWANLYMRCLLESYNIQKEFLTTTFINAVSYELEQLGAVLSQNMNRDDKYKLAYSCYDKIKLLDQKYQADLQKQSDKRRKKMEKQTKILPAQE